MDFEKALQIVSDELTENNWHTLAIMLDVFGWQIDPESFSIKLPDNLTVSQVMECYEMAVQKMNAIRLAK